MQSTLVNILTYIMGYHIQTLKEDQAQIYNDIIIIDFKVLKVLRWIALRRWIEPGINDSLRVNENGITAVFIDIENRHAQCS